MLVHAKVKILTVHKGLCAHNCPFIERHSNYIFRFLHCCLIDELVEMHHSRSFYVRHSKCLKLRKA